MSVHHISIYIPRAIEELKKGNNLFYPSSPSEALTALLQAQDKGYEVYTSCDSVDSRGYCKGHEGESK